MWFRHTEKQSIIPQRLWVFVRDLCGRNKRIERCVMWKNGKCNSVYAKIFDCENCDGIKIHENCPYKKGSKPKLKKGVKK